MSSPARTDIDARHRFDLQRIYESPAEWETEYGRLLDQLDDLRSPSESPVSSTEEIELLLETLTDCFRRKQRLELYATLAKNVATGDDAAADRRRRYRELVQAFDPAITAALRRLRDAAPSEIERLTEEHRWYAENLHEQARYVRSPDVEEAVAAFEEPLTAPSRLFEAIRNDDFEPPVVEQPDGDTVEIRYGNLRTELSHRDRAYRRRVYEAYHEEADRFEHSLTQTFAEKLKAARADVSVRGYDSIRDRAFRQRSYPESGLRSSLPGEVHDVLLDTVRENLDPYHDALELRRRRLGVETLRPWDLHVSIADTDPPKIDYETAKAHIVDALSPLGEEYVGQLREFFADRRVDVFPTENKRTDIPAYCPSSANDGAFILANFREDLRTTFFLCHELGHAMHVEHERERPIQYATAPRPLEEIPSILHELLLVEHLVEEGDALAGAARNRLLESVGGNFYGATYSSAFTHALAKRVEDGEAITVDRTRDLVRSLRDEFLAPVEFGDHPGRRLRVRGTRELYSNYQYVLGVTGALVIRDRLRNGDLTVETYREFLRSTGCERSVDLFERVGCDVRTQTPFESAAEAFTGMVARFSEA